jgi:carboxymethylenebutenolidase
MSRRRAILTETVEVPVDNGPSMGAYLARPAEPGPCPGVLVGMELFGLSGHVRDVCERLAGLGFAALAPDLYHRTAPGVELAEDAAGRERGLALLGQLTREHVLADVAADARDLHASGSARVGMVGLSVGGHVAYLAATQLDLAAVAVVYGGWIPTTDIPIGRPEPTLAATPGIVGRVLLVVGEHDRLIPPAHRQAIADALRAAHVRHEIVEYPGALHGFLSDRRDVYDPGAARDAWQRIRQLLATELGAPLPANSSILTDGT